MILLSKGEIPLFIKPNLVFALAATLLLPLPAFTQSTSGDKKAEPHNLPYSINRAEPATAPADKVPKQDSAEPQEAEQRDGSKEQGNHNQQPQQPKAAEW
ncbi:MAG: hypothetical protein K2X93_10105, partial [Candidatus Obscuribacterales bacterium]|nr:hypothetical protein [Candidatus Obscuribacterales bacterium]